MRFHAAEPRRKPPQFHNLPCGTAEARDSPKANTESKGKRSVPRRGKMDTENRERGKQCKQTPGDVGNTTKTKQTKFDLTAVRHLLLEGLVRSLLPVRGGYNSRATMLHRQRAHKSWRGALLLLRSIGLESVGISPGNQKQVLP